ncbi:MAG: hypothetical protein ACSHX6_06975 [Akkermansiaceae bacterium]
MPKLYLILMLTCNLTWLYSTSILQKPPSPPQTTITIPQQYQNLPLQKCTPSHLEAQFAKHFPGIIETYQHPQGLIIFRQVTGATRKLHNSRTCLKSSGFTLSPPTNTQDPTGTIWQTYTAQNTQIKLTVKSTILSHSHSPSPSPSGTKSWPSAEQWFWQALFSHPDKTYLAITEINNVK